VLHHDGYALGLHIRQSMLANAWSHATDDEARRQRIVDYIAVLADVCSRYTSHVSDWDYFHPHTAGQNVLA
jgi:hypothetical protein